MSRYFLLFLLNIPFVIAAILSVIVSYKMKKTTKRRLISQLMLWLIVLAGLIGAEPLYEWLFTHNLTVSEPLSIFDVIQITAIVIVFYIANRSAAKVVALEKRVQDLHQEMSIRLSKNNSK
jgi:hypothetical protein